MNRADFKRRRKQLMRMMGSDSIAIVPAAPELLRNRDVHYPYRPDSDFFYLTGFAEPEAVAVLIPGRNGMAAAPGSRAPSRTTMPTMLSPSAISTRSCRACWSSVSGSTTPWDVTPGWISRCRSGSPRCARGSAPGFAGRWSLSPWTTTCTTCASTKAVQKSPLCARRRSSRHRRISSS